MSPSALRGTFNTPMYQEVIRARAGEPMPMTQKIKREGQPWEIAALVCWLLCDESKYITGTVQLIDGGWVC